MPHLSPMLWALSSLMFLLIIFVFNSSLWWHRSPIFPAITVSSTKFYNPHWNWS